MVLLSSLAIILPLLILLNVYLVPFIFVKSLIDEKYIHAIGVIIGAAPYFLLLIEKFWLWYYVFTFGAFSYFVLLLYYLSQHYWWRALLTSVLSIPVAILAFPTNVLATQVAAHPLVTVLGYATFALSPMVSALAVADVMQLAATVLGQRRLRHCPLARF